MSPYRKITRRTVLKGMGAAIALPALECMVPARCSAAGSAASALPKRLAFVYVPNGVHMPEWTPAGTQADFTLPRILQPLDKVKDKLLVLSGLAHDKARANGDGAGDHARSSAVFLTGCQPRKTSGADIKAGVSVDQIAAAQIGKATRLPSLELGCDRGQQAGSCDSGYSCAYSSNISWKTESMPMAKEIDPRQVFERLFSDGSQQAAAARAQREKYRQSILDYALDDARRLKRRISGADTRKVDEYLASIRDLELRIEKTRQASLQQQRDLPEFEVPDGIPQEYAQHIRLMCDLLVLAFQGDVTRVATFLVANEGSNRTYPWLGVSDGHHYLSHHGNDQAKLEKITRINVFHAEQFAYLLQRLDAVSEGQGTLLDNSMIVYGSCIGDGNRHNHDNLPVLLAGRGGGTVRAGRHLTYPKDTPMTNLYLALLDRLGVEAEQVGDSTGRVDNLA